ncbi:MAG: Minf_1886 family protein, partial [Planctomycetota bacterium]
RHRELLQRKYPELPATRDGVTTSAASDTDQTPSSIDSGDVSSSDMNPSDVDAHPERLTIQSEECDGEIQIDLQVELTIHTQPQNLPEELQMGVRDLGDDLGHPVVAGQHITGQQLCHAARMYALSQYGFLAAKVLSQWGIRSTGDLGNLVYNLIKIEQMHKSDSDRREDFDDVYSFDDAFHPEFSRLMFGPDDIQD